MRGDKVFVRDFNSTNGTLVNNEAVTGERELHNQDQLTLGPLLFRVVLEVSPPVNKPTPMPPTAPAAAQDDEAAAALLLSLQDEPGGPSPGTNVDSEGVPTGSTVMDVIAPASSPPAEAEGEGNKGGGAERERAAKAAAGNTSSAAKAILEKYMRRPRT
jgi:pSer/pThr/pTyr-binding forkhead associated (FHA) protein